jgi:hypothetical protein
VSDSPIDEIRLLRDDVNALKYLFEGDDYRPGLRADIHQMAADVRAIKTERAARAQRRQSARWASLLALPLAVVAVLGHQYLLISDYRHGAGIPPLVSLIAGGLVELIVVFLVVLAAALWSWGH